MDKIILENTIEVISEENCYGCTACYNRCPCQAISMEENQEGFSFPLIDHTKCIRCGLCLKVCPAQHPQYKNDPNPECYAVMAEDKIREASSSGGVFTLIANYVLEQGGVVCGAAFNDSFTAVEHIIISSVSELHRLRGSKYVQSDLGTIYSQIENHLKKGTPTLFTGCPCQVAGLYAFLGHDYSNLYTVDLVCHGVPSPKAYRKFFEEQSLEGTSIARISFRDKKRGGWNHSTTIEYKNGELKYFERSKSPWMRSFLNLISIRKSCGNCSFAKLPRQGDITLGDFWDIGRYKESLDDKKGTSLLLKNNDKGKALLNIISSKASVFEKVPLEHAKKYNAQIYASSILHPRRKRFFDLLNIYDFSKAVDYGMNRRFDIGYVGWWYGKNYGSALTSYAMHETLTQLGKTVLMLEWPEHKKTSVPPENTPVRRFAKKHYEISLRDTYDNLQRLNYHCDTFLVGSDQLWNYYSVKENGFYFFLDFVDPSKRKIAYATSFGHNYSFFPKDQNRRICELLNQFNAISVREKEGISICKNTFGVDAVQVLDPVFLCGAAAYDKAISDSQVQVKEKYILGYILDPTEEKRSVLLQASNAFGIPVKIILDGQEDLQVNKKRMHMDEAVLENVGIEDWLAYFKHASYVITDSYHGLCFSILFQKQFICIGNKKRGMSRFSSLLKLTGLEDRFIIDINEHDIDYILHSIIEYNDPTKRLNIEAQKSLAWLKKALEEPNIKQPSIESILSERIRTLEQELSELKKQTKSSPETSTSMTDDKKPQNDASILSKIKKVIRFYRLNGFSSTLKRIGENHRK